MRPRPPTAGFAAIVAGSVTAMTAAAGTAGAAGSRRAFLSATSLLIAAIEFPILADDLVELALRQPQALLHAANLPHVG